MMHPEFDFLDREDPGKKNQVQVFNMGVCGDFFNRDFLCGENYHLCRDFSIGIFQCGEKQRCQ
jgi:hypothetical protein